MKTIYNIDKVRICLLQHENCYDYIYSKFQSSANNEIHFDGFYLTVEESDCVNDKDITAILWLEDEIPVELGTFTFNKSKKYGSKCFFTYATKSLYMADNIYKDKKSNYFTYPFYTFGKLGLMFNNITSIEIACDTESSVINKIQYAVGKPEVFDMVLLHKKVSNPEDVLVGYWEYYQRSRIRKAPRPSLYIHRLRPEAGNGCSLKVYDKARELAQFRLDKEVLIRAWNGMGDRIQRMEITVENKQFKRFFEKMNKDNHNRWLVFSKPTTREKRQDEYREGIEHFFFDLGMDEGLREAMFVYFSDILLHFKLRNHDKTPVSLVDLTVNSLADLKKLWGNKCKPQCKPSKNINM